MNAILLCVYVFAAFYGSLPFPGTLVESEKQFYHSATTITCKDFKYPDAVNFTVLYSYGHSFTNDSVGLDERHLWFQKHVNVLGLKTYSDIFFYI